MRGVSGGPRVAEWLLFEEAVKTTCSISSFLFSEKGLHPCPLADRFSAGAEPCMLGSILCHGSIAEPGGRISEFKS